MSGYDVDARIRLGILEIKQIKIILPNVTQSKADQLSKELNEHILDIVTSFVKALSNDS